MAKFPYPLQIIDAECVRLWVKLDSDFSLVSISNLTKFQKLYPEHSFAFFLQEAGLDSLVDCPYQTVPIPGTNSTITLQEELWALKNGIIPHQPFHIQVNLWNSVSNTPEGTEYDSGADIEILEILPVKHAAKFWSNWHTQHNRYLQRLAAEIPLAEKTIRTHLGGLAIREEYYFADSYDDMAMPGGIRLTLYSRIEPVSQTGERLRQGQHFSISGESKDGKREIAMQNLQTNLGKYYPNFTEIPLEDIPVCSTRLPVIKITAN
jgi:hypothetical protein